MSGRSFFIWILAGLLAAAAAIGLAVTLRVPIAQVIFNQVAGRAGIPIRAMTIATLDQNGVLIENISLGDETGPSIDAIDVSWTPQSLANGRVTTIAVRNPRLTLDYAQNAFAVDGLKLPAGASDSKPYFSRIDVTDARANMRTQWGTVTILGGGYLSYAENGTSTFGADIESAILEIAGGRLSVSDVTFRAGQPLRAAVSVSKVELEPLIELFAVDGLSGTGTMSGTIPVRLSGTQLAIADGKLAALGPGTLRYSGDALPKDMPGADPETAGQVALARAALADFRYKSLAMELTRAESGDGVVLLKLDGSNPAVLDDHPIVLNIRLETNFDKLADLLTQGLDAAESLRRRGLKAAGK